MTWQRTKATVVESALTQRTNYCRCYRLPWNVLASLRAGATLVIYELGKSGTTLSCLFHAVLGLGTAVDTPALYFANASPCAEIEAIIPTWAIFIQCAAA